MKYRDWLSSSLYCCAFESDDKMTDMLDECVEHTLIVWKTDKTQLRYDALWRVIMAYAYSDRKEQAKEYAYLFPESENNYANRDRALTVCLEGKDLLMHKQKDFSKALADFTDACQSFSDFGDRRDPRTRQAVTVEKSVYDALFPNGNSLRYSLPISNIHWKTAEFAMTDGNHDKAIHELSISRRLRMEADRAISAVGEHHTAPLLDTIVYDSPGEILSKSQLEYWREELRESKLFLPLKGRSDFEVLTE